MTVNIGIIGYGVVGKAAENTLIKKYKIVKYDKYQDLNDFDEIGKCDFVFIMVPTPFDCNVNKVDDSAVLESLAKLQEINYKGIAIIKSTLPPGYCSNYSKLYDLEIVFNPEFLRESTTPNEDFENQEVVVLGTDDQNIFQRVKQMFQEVLLPNARYYHTTTQEAEMIKCAQNTMLASRVAIANMIFDSCTENKIDYNLVRKVAFDQFEIIGPHMSLVPGPDGNRGFGGKCLPKDIRAFSTVSNSKLLDEIIGYNDSLRNDLNKFLKNYEHIN